MRPLSRFGNAVLLAAAIHADWHLARAGHHGSLSGDWAQHWVMAVPVFALLAHLVERESSAARWRESVWVIVGGAVAGQLLEPLAEMLTGGMGWSWLVQGPRWTAFAEFMAAGFATFLLVMAWKSRSVEGPRSAG